MSLKEGEVLPLAVGKAMTEERPYDDDHDGQAVLGQLSAQLQRLLVESLDVKTSPKIVASWLVRFL